MSDATFLQSHMKFSLWSFLLVYKMHLNTDLNADTVELSLEEVFSNRNKKYWLSTKRFLYEATGAC